MTYAELIARLQTWVESTETDMVANLDTIIEYAELRVYKTVDLNEARLTSSVTLTPSDPEVTLPSGLVTIRTVTLDVSGALTLLEQKEVSFLDDYTGARTVEGTPRYYAWLDDSTILLAPAPDAADDVQIAHTIRPTQLSSSETTTWLSLNASDVLMYSCLIELATFLKQEADMVQAYQAKYQEAVKTLLLEENYRNRTDRNREGEIRVQLP